MKEIKRKPPTQKQLDFAETIGHVLGVDPPFGGSSYDYSDFIDEYYDEFVRERNKRRYGSCNVFELQHMYSLADFDYEEININPETL